MRPDPARIAGVREWLQRAPLDLRGARIDLEARPPLLEDALFHCQQIVEKSLKGFLAWHDVPFRKTHSLEELGTGCERIDPGLSDSIPSDAVLLRRVASGMHGSMIRCVPGFHELRLPTEV